jgi:hypothetical protein
MIRSLRISSGADRDKWHAARRALLEVGFNPVLVMAVELAYDIALLEVAPPRNLDPDGLCLADLPMVTRGSRRVAVVAVVGLEEFLQGTSLLEALRLGTREAEIRVVCPQDLAPLLEGFDLQIIDRDRFLRDNQDMEAQTAAIRAFAPDLIVNLDRQRRITGDLLVGAAGAAGVLGFDDETPANANDPSRLSRSRLYRRVLAKDAPWQAVATALGIQPRPARLWLDQARRTAARRLLEEAGWDPARTLCVLGDHPEALTGSGVGELERAGRDGWTAIGLGGVGTQPVLDKALRSFGTRARNLGGALPLADMAAILQACGAFTGGSATFKALAGAAGCSSYAPRPS